MAITKLSNIGTPQGGGAAHLKNCISYILNSDKTEGLVGGNAGTTPQEVYQVMMDTKQEWEKENNCIKETERKEDKVMTEADNKFSKRVISYGIFLTGAAIALLGGLAEKGKILVIAVGIALVLLALWLYPKKER